LVRPFDEDEICALVTEAVRQQAARKAGNIDGEIAIPLEFEGMLGVSLPMREVFQRILEAASEDISVLITGETGTGKDMVAAAIHKRSRRKNGPYIAVNTGAMPSELIASELFGHERGAYTGAVETTKGRFEEARGGTIFLDEISTVNEKAQVSLLRVLETKTFRRVGGEKDICVDVRVIAASNENLEEAVGQKRFREDLFYRLDVFHIHVPPLRDRPGGVTLLSNHFVPHFNAVYKKQVRTITPETWRYLRSYPWPGNVRELKNVIQRAVLMAKGEALTPELLPLRIRAAITAETDTAAQYFPIHPGMTLDAVEKEFILMTLAFTQGNKKEAAEKLGISRRALYDKLKKYSLR
jgi:DNA-binding NtrC family response regulator